MRCGGEEALAVFNFREEAELFVGLEELAPGGWAVRETSRGELASALCGPCAGVGGVALDPLPRAAVADEAVLGLLIVGREGFLERLLTHDGGHEQGVRPTRPGPRDRRPGPPRTARSEG